VSASTSTIEKINLSFLADLQGNEKPDRGILRSETDNEAEFKV